MKLINLSEDDLKEIFSLFSSFYNSKDDLFYLNQNITDEYEITEEKAEIARDSIRAVLYWLKKKDFH